MPCANPDAVASPWPEVRCEWDPGSREPFPREACPWLRPASASGALQPLAGREQVPAGGRARRSRRSRACALERVAGRSGSIMDGLPCRAGGSSVGALWQLGGRSAPGAPPAVDAHRVMNQLIHCSAMCCGPGEAIRILTAPRSGPGPPRCCPRSWWSGWPGAAGGKAAARGSETLKGELGRNPWIRGRR